MQVQITVTLERTDLTAVNKHLSKALRNDEVLAQLVRIFGSMGIDVDVKTSAAPNGARTRTSHADHPPQARRTRR